METSSRTIAGVFGKQHQRVLHAIEHLEIPPDFRASNFRRSSYQSLQNKEMPEIMLTRDGFTTLCMGFTGAKAMEWKLKYIKAFNDMEAHISKDTKGIDWEAARAQIKISRSDLVSTVADFVAYATAQGSESANHYYANVTKMEYKALGLLERQQTALGNFRDTLNILDIGYLNTAENVATAAIAQGMEQKMHYKEIYQFAKQKVNDYAQAVSFARLAKPTPTQITK
jgi:Rha family phage regulatory protein